MAGKPVPVDFPAFVPVTISEGSVARKAEVPRAEIAGMIEIETAGALMRVPAGVDPRTLKVVLAALRRGS